MGINVIKKYKPFLEWRTKTNEGKWEFKPVYIGGELELENGTTIEVVDGENTAIAIVVNEKSR